MNSFLNSEYNNAGELYGFGELEAEFNAASPIKRAQMLKKLSTPNPAKGSRAEMENYFSLLPQHIREELKKGNLRLTDYTIYSTKLVSSKTVKMFESQDGKEIGVSNIANQKLPKNMVFIVSGIYLLAGNAPEVLVTPSEAPKMVQFGSISDWPAIANGEFSLKANKKQIIAENQSNRCFVTDNHHGLRLGYYKLDNPRLIRDEEVIEFTLELGTMTGIDTSRTHVFVGLDGTGTTP